MVWSPYTLARFRELETHWELRHLTIAQPVSALTAAVLFLVLDRTQLFLDAPSLNRLFLTL
jgi:hypothetical protein